MQAVNKCDDNHTETEGCGHNPRGASAIEQVSGKGRLVTKPRYEGTGNSRHDRMSVSHRPAAGAQSGESASLLGHAGTYHVGAQSRQQPTRPCGRSSARSRIAAMQYGQRMVKVVSVGIGRLLHRSKGERHAGFHTAVWQSAGKEGSHRSRIDIEPMPAPSFRQACRYIGRSGRCYTNVHHRSALIT